MPEIFNNPQVEVLTYEEYFKNLTSRETLFQPEIIGGKISDTTDIEGVLKWIEISNTTYQLLENEGAVTNNAALVTVTLPATSEVGSLCGVVGKGAGGWKLAQAAGQQIIFGRKSTTAGTGGYLSSNNRYDAVELICTVANTTFEVRNSQGNITIL